MLTLEQTLQQDFLQARFLLLELAALLDRADLAASRSNASATSHPNLQTILAALQILASPSLQPNRAQQILRLFSGPEF